MGVFYLKSNDFELKLHMDYCPNKVLKGDSGTGKTYLVNRLYAFQEEKALRKRIIETNIDLDSLILVKNQSDAEYFKMRNLDEISEQLIIFDMADLYIDRSLVDFINTGRNIVFVVTKGSGVAGYIKRTFKSNIELKLEVENGIVRILGEPMF